MKNSLQNVCNVILNMHLLLVENEAWLNLSEVYLHQSINNLRNSNIFTNTYMEIFQW